MRGFVPKELWSELLNMWHFLEQRSKLYSLLSAIVLGLPNTLFAEMPTLPDLKPAFAPSCAFVLVESKPPVQVCIPDKGQLVSIKERILSLVMQDNGSSIGVVHKGAAKEIHGIPPMLEKLFQELKLCRLNPGCSDRLKDEGILNAVSALSEITTIWEAELDYTLNGYPPSIAGPSLFAFYFESNLGDFVFWSENKDFSIGVPGNWMFEYWIAGREFF